MNQLLFIVARLAAWGFTFKDSSLTLRMTQNINLKDTHNATQPQQKRRKEMTALRPIKKKIQSERGASITFALLLFLVCAVVGSAVLTAGSAAAGRMSKIAENDQRYYSVNSAARLLIDLVEADEIKVTKETDVSSDSFTYELKGRGDEEYQKVSADETTLFTSLALEAAYQLSERMTETDTKKTHTLDLQQLGASDSDPLSVKIEETIFADGRLQFEISKDKLYRIRMVFQNIGSDSGTEKSFKWALNDVESVREALPSQPSPSPTPAGT